MDERTTWAIGLEHRLTVLEVAAARQREVNAKVWKKLTLMERGLVLMLIALNTLAHEKIPEWSKWIVTALKMGSG